MTAGRQILSLNRFDAGNSAWLDDDLAALIARRQAVFGAASVLFYEEPIIMERAEGAVMIARDGRRFLDVYNNVPSVGHGHPHVAAAVARQIGKLNIHTRYLVEPVIAYAEKLLATFPPALANLAMTCTGSESNDLALRIARAWTGGTGFIVTETAYHGNTAAVTEVSPSSFRSREVPAHVRTVAAPDVGTGPAEDLAARFAGQVSAAIADMAANGIRFAGLLVDTIFSSDGIHADPPGFLAAAVEAVRKAGGLFIADEVQPGFGRTGRQMWGFERHGLVPDIVTLGKPMGNGFPVGGVVTRPELLTGFCETTGYFNTFGGNPVAAAAGLAVLEVIEAEGLRENAEDVGAYFRAGLRDLGARHVGIGAVRGAGLFIGLDFVEAGSRAPDTAGATHAINALKQRGVLIGAAGSFGNTLKIRPPLCFSRANADEFLEKIDEVLAAR
ncbi:aspartate aminotransferase family protein [Ancylobacter terrae]|uniref:aspartate aminotransferase family protein n=1 Tax=Ancylobacter sp. sgz301288 TaxID=3342077 RepID=UPI00385B7E63